MPSSFYPVYLGPEGTAWAGRFQSRWFFWLIFTAPMLPIGALLFYLTPSLDPYAGADLLPALLTGLVIGSGIIWINAYLRRRAIAAAQQRATLTVSAQGLTLQPEQPDAVGAISGSYQDFSRIDVYYYLPSGLSHVPAISFGRKAMLWLRLTTTERKRVQMRVDFRELPAGQREIFLEQLAQLKRQSLAQHRRIQVWKEA